MEYSLTIFCIDSYLQLPTTAITSTINFQNIFLEHWFCVHSGANKKLSYCYFCFGYLTKYSYFTIYKLRKLPKSLIKFTINLWLHC